MIKIVLFILTACFLGGCREEKSNRALIAGKALPGNKVILQQSQGGVNKFVYQAEADSAGHYRLEYVPEHTGIFNVVSGNFSVPLVIKPGECIEIDMSGEQPCIEGDAMERQAFVQELNKQKKVWAKEFPKSYTDALAFREQEEKQYAALRDYLAGTEFADEEVKGVLLADARVRHYAALLKFPFMSQVLTGKIPEMPGEYYSFLEETDLGSPYIASLGDMNPFLQELFPAMEEHGYLEGTKEDYLLKRAEWIADNRMREDYLLYVIEQVEFSGYNQYLGRQMEKMGPFMVTERGKTKMKELADKYAASALENRKFNAGQPAIDFSGFDSDGNEHRLSEYKGKVVVVDVWNTGCKPCIAEIPYLKRLEKRFEGQDVVFISYAVEANPGAWREFIRVHEMVGSQWIHTEAFKSPFAQEYKVRFIPRFMVFSKKGEIVDVYAPRPSHPRLARLIEEELKKEG